MEILLKTHTKSQFETTTRQRPHEYYYIFILYAISILGDYAPTKTEKPGHLDLPHNSLQNYEAKNLQKVIKHPITPKKNWQEWRESLNLIPYVLQ